jgi:hypothetical protein
MAELGPLFGIREPTVRPPKSLDPRIPRGRSAFESEQRLPTGEPPACSFRRPVCVHRPAGVDGAVALAWLADLETAHDRLALGLEAPEPLSDFDKGGGPAFDLYLEEGAASARVGIDPVFAAHRDAAAAFCVVGAEHEPRARDATLCLAGGIGHRLDSAEPEPLRRALAEHLWLLVGNPTSADVASIDDAQLHPESATLDREGPSGPALLLYEYLDARRRGVPTGVALVLHAAAAGGASPPGLRFENEPDVWDVFRASFGPEPSKVGAFISGFAVARAFLGSRSVGEHVPSLDFSGPSGRVAFTWNVTLSSLPRNLALSEPVGPLGSAYLWLDIDEPVAGTTLAMRAEWEGPVAFVWSLVTVDAQGRAMGRFDAPYVERATSVERTVADLEGARGVLVVGTNLGNISPAFPFDPDFSPHEPHAASVYLAKLPRG